MLGTLYSSALQPARGGVVAFPEAPGPGLNVHTCAERLASLGYDVMVADLHGGGQLLTNFPEIMAQLDKLRSDAQTVRVRARAAYEAALKATGHQAHRLAAIGFCFGGTMALELARDGAELGAVVGFHNGLSPLAEPVHAKLNCPILVCIGADDPSIPPPVRAAFEAEMINSKSDWSMALYGKTIHSFTDVNADKMGRPEFARYSPDADASSWDAMISLFNRVIK